MGNACALRYAVAVAAIAGLTGCDSPRLWTREEIVEIAGEAEPYNGGNTQLTMELEADIVLMKREIKDLEARLDLAEAEIRANAAEAQAIESAQRAFDDQVLENLRWLKAHH